MVAHLSSPSGHVSGANLFGKGAVPCGHLALDPHCRELSAC